MLNFNIIRLSGIRLTVSLAICLNSLAIVESADNSKKNGPDPKPNIVFILADDLGWRDLSNEGSTFYESPNIDRIANGGMKFTRGYATCQVCSPSRASIMTGKYPARLNITDYIGAAMGENWRRNTRLLPATYESSLPHDETTIAEAFKEAGYSTFFAGKWHLGGKGSWPNDHGFDINIGGHHRGSPPGGFFAPYSNPAMENGPKGELLPIRLSKETAQFIHSNGDKPFFAVLSFYSVHAPMQTKQALWKKYRDKAVRQGLPESRFIVDRTSPVRQVQDHPLYAGMIESMDEGVGIVLDTLQHLGLEDNTVVVFTSDNGGVAAGDAKATANLPLRGGKGRQFEGGIREPYYIKWPGTGQGKTCSTPVTGTDFYPTLLEIAGIDPKPEQHVDGISLVPLLKGQTIEREYLYWHYPHYSNQAGDPSSIAMKGDWKLINYHESGRNELYNVAADVGETTDVSAQHPEVVAELLSQLHGWLNEVDARQPTPNPNFDPAKFRQQQLQTLKKRLKSLEQGHASFLNENYKPKPDWWQNTGK